MRLKAPCQGIDFRTRDVYGDPFQLSNFMGKRVVLSFFRDAACPFCNFRVYELTQKYKEWQENGVEVIAVFSSPSKEVREFVAQHPRPFALLSDPRLELYNHYGVEKSLTAVLKACMFRLPRVMKGLFKGGKPKVTRNVNVLPADFLLDVDGRVMDLWYGRDASDHIPMDRLESFIYGEQKRVDKRKPVRKPMNHKKLNHKMA